MTRTTAARRAAPGVVGTISALALAIGLSLFSVQAHAVLRGVPETGSPGMLTLSSDLVDHDRIQITPGTPTYWQIEATLDGQEHGSLNMELRKSGDIATHAEGLTVMVERCNETWTNVPVLPQCADNRKTVVFATPIDDHASGSPLFDLDGLPAAKGKHLLVTLALGDTGSSTTALTGRIGFGLTAAGEDPATASTAGTLASTGVDVVALLLIALGAVGLGVAASAARRARNARLDNFLDHSGDPA